MIGTPASLAGTPDRAGAAVDGDPFAVVPTVLDLVRLTGALFFRASFRSPWAYAAPPAHVMVNALPEGLGALVLFHIVARGRCWVRVDGGEPRTASAGDVVTIPYADGHLVGSTEPSDPVSITSLLPPLPWHEMPHIVYGGAGEETAIVCGYLRGDAVLFDPVLRALPPLFVVSPPPGPAASWVRACVDYALASSTSTADARRVDRRLPELLFTEVLRLYLQRPDEVALTGWLSALRDPVVGRAMSLMHADPARDWTVNDLARQVAVSKTVLAERFQAELSRPPIRYLAQWRMNLASGLLRSTSLSVAQVAIRVGYHSEESFSRAFKRALGQAPGRWRAAPVLPNLF